MPDEGLSETALLQKELDELAQLTEYLPSVDASLRVKISSINQTLRARVRAALTAPVTDQQDFKARISQLIHAHRQARFDADVEVAAANLFAYLKTAQKEDTVEYWQAHTLLYELSHIFRLTPLLNKEVMQSSREVLNELQALAADLEGDDKAAPDQRRLIEEKVRYCACRGNELKRSGKPEESQRLLEWLLNFTEDKLKEEGSFSCHSAQADLTYYLGSVYRILEKHNLAEEMYTRSLNLLHEEAQQGDSTPDANLFIIRKQAMVIGIGFGWINLTRGFLRRAENTLITARSLMARSSDPLVPSYIELLYGTIKRCRAGTDPTKLQNSIESLSLARDKFEEISHPRYVARACWELCLAYILLGGYQAAREHLDVVAEHAKQTGHPKWLTNVSIGRSRILRGEGDIAGALEQAKLAIQSAEGCKSALPMVDAYITLGEIMLLAAEDPEQENVNYHSAREVFEAAREIALESSHTEWADGQPSNPKIVAVCTLRIAQCHAREWEETKAKEYLAEWDALRSNVEHEWVRELAGRVREEIDSLSMNFTVPANNKHKWNYAENIGTLQQWLLAQALRESKGSVKEAADLIGVERATLYQWQDKSRKPPTRARINTSSRRPAKKGTKKS
jgi:tetratricopeptide (TPR) repeat protein